MKNFTLLLTSLLIISSSAYARTPAEREAVELDTVGVHHARQELRQVIHENKKEIIAERREMHSDRYELRRHELNKQHDVHVKHKHHHRKKMKK
jgi:hypothetical protein